MPNEVQTLTGHPVIESPIRNAQSQESRAADACYQDVQSTWKRPDDIATRQQNGDVTTQMAQGASGKMGDSKCGGLPSLQIENLDSNMGPFDPNASKLKGNNNLDKGGCPQFEQRQQTQQPAKDDFKNGNMKEKHDGSKCGGTSGGGETIHSETHTTQRRMSESERAFEQKLIDQKIREMKLRERSKL